MSWIHFDDEAALILFALENASVFGPLNAVAPDPIRNVDFTRELASVLRRPAFFRMPAFVLQMLAGEFSRELLDSKRLVPKTAIEHGFDFRFPVLQNALGDLVG